MNKSFSRRFSLRFKQWSRKFYAAFKSVGRQVTIGRLKNVVADALLGKQKNLIPEFAGILNLHSKISPASFQEPPDEELQLAMIPVPVLKQENTYCAPGNSDVTIQIFIWLKAFIHKAFSFFYNCKN